MTSATPRARTLGRSRSRRAISRSSARAAVTDSLVGGDRRPPVARRPGCTRDHVERPREAAAVAAVAQARALALDGRQRQLLAAARDQLEGALAQRRRAANGRGEEERRDDGRAEREPQRGAPEQRGEQRGGDAEDDGHRELRAQHALTRLGAGERVVGTEHRRTSHAPQTATAVLNAVSRPPAGGIKKPARARLGLARLGLADAVADARDRLDQLGLARIALDLAAQRGDVDAQQVALAVARAPTPPG